MPFPSVLPSPRLPDPRRIPVLRWAVAGPGWIAERFVQALKADTNQRVVAVNSRSLERARAFAARWDIPKAYDGIADLVTDLEVVVYVATPHNHHFPVALAAVEAGNMYWSKSLWP